MLFCKIYKEFFTLSYSSLGNADVYKTEKQTRSKMECATMCYSDKKCMTAVYRKNGDCHFIKDLATTLVYDDGSNSYQITQDVLEMRSRLPKHTQVKSTCQLYKHYFLSALL